MTSDSASSLLRAWLDLKSLEDDPPLLNVAADEVTPILATGKRSRLRCSPALVDAIADLSTTIIADWNKARAIEGIAYLIYRRHPDGAAHPLYVGIANAAGKGGTQPSALWGIRGARFCDSYGSNGHVDCLSRSLLGSYGGYAPWVAALFGPTPVAPAPHLRPLLSPVYVHLELWNASAHRVHPGTPNAPLYVEEMLRLWVLKAAGYGSTLLNRDGN